MKFNLVELFIKFMYNLYYFQLLMIRVEFAQYIMLGTNSLGPGFPDFEFIWDKDLAPADAGVGCRKI